MKNLIVTLIDGTWFAALVFTLASGSIPLWVFLCVSAFVYVTTLRPMIKVLYRSGSSR